MADTKIKLAIVDDHQIVIDGLNSLLKGHDCFEIVLETTRPETVPTNWKKQGWISLTDVK